MKEGWPGRTADEARDGLAGAETDQRGNKRWWTPRYRRRFTALARTRRSLPDDRQALAARRDS